MKTKLKYYNRLTMKTIFTLSFLLMLTFSGMAQENPVPGPPQGNPRDRIEAIKIAFISQRLNLSPEEAQKFWPVFNQYTMEIKALRKQNNGKEEPLTAEQQLAFEQKKIDLKRKYMAPIEKIIGTERLNTLYGLEHEFKQKLMQMREMQEGRPGNGTQRPYPPQRRP